MSELTTITGSAITASDLRAASSLVFVTGPSPEPVLTITPDGELHFRDATDAAQAIRREWDRIRGADLALAARLETCADQSEMGLNFAGTPQACREAASILRGKVS